MVNELTILRPFLTRPEESLHLAELSRLTKIPHPTARLHLAALERKGIVQKSHKGRLTLYALSKTNPLLADYLTLAEKRVFIEKCEANPVFCQMISELKSIFSGTCLIVFGSASQSFKKSSDIDLLVIGKMNTDNARKIGERYNKPAHLVIAKLEDITVGMKLEILRKHLIVEATSDVLRWLYWQA
ncbi:MAG: helix-turn-helix domain-containing protein [Nanoarchaeota archaeon]